MAKYSDFTQGPNKKRPVSLKKKIVQGAMWALVVLIVISFVFWVGGKNGPEGQGFPVIAKVNGAEYQNRPYSPFWYINNEVREQMISSVYSQFFSPEKLAQFIFVQSVENLVSQAIVYDFAKLQNIHPSSELIKSYYQNEIATKNYQPNDDFIQYISMVYAFRGLIGTSGDIPHSVGYYSEVGLYSFLDVVQYNAQIEVIYLDVTNFIAGKVELTQVANFYQDKNFAQEIVIQDIMIKTKDQAQKVIDTAQKEGWDKAIELYKTNDIVISNKMLLTKEGDTASRFAEAINYYAGDFIPNIVYEKGRYHLMKVVSVPEFSSISKDYQKYIAKEYVKYYFPILEKKYQPDIDASIAQIKLLISQNTDLKIAAEKSGWEYAKSMQFSALADSIMTEKNDAALPLPTGNNDVMDFIFLKDKNAVSDLFNLNGFYFFVKNISREVKVETKTTEEIVDLSRDYVYLKSDAIIKDWMDNLKAKSKIEVDKDKLKMMYLQ
ncbi:MAG: hypothetical protein A2Y33_04815 [Spirochaetes bacterium GWF1_51_8]|nr:MAG: hypothetical protein A2Y33_04815 [Spirochaetes bacterium GWF1_51_8]